MECSSTSITSVNLKPILSELGHVSRADGSSSFSQGETIVHCAVYGPTEVRIQKELESEANVDVIYKPKTGIPGCGEKFLEHLIKGVCRCSILLTQYPRTNVTIILQEIQNAGCLLSCGLNAACLALVDAGVAMRSLFASATCIIDHSGQIILAPDSSLDKDAQATMTFAFDSQEYNKIFSIAEGIFSQEEYTQGLAICRDAAKNIVHFYHDAVTRSLSKTT